MKTKFITLVSGLFFAFPILAQDRTTVNAKSSEISDNLNLRAVASVFGDSKNLEDFERRLNDPKLQISNLDLNFDNQVDYLRVIESTEDNTHLVIIQSVLGVDTYQDVATIEVERGSDNQVSVQVVGDVYMYGPDYIYEPVYVHSPVIYNSFWVSSYRPYRSVWYWGYYPTYYSYWHPYPAFRYRRNVYRQINTYNNYNYVTVRRSQRAATLYSTQRSNYAERQYPTRSFASRNTSVRNQYELDQTRRSDNTSIRNGGAGNVRNTPRPPVRTNSNPVRENGAAGTRTNTNPVRTNSISTSDASTRTRENNTTVQTSANVRTNPTPVRENNIPRTQTSIRNNNDPVHQNTRIQNTAQRNHNQTRSASPQSNPVRAQRQETHTQRNDGGGRSNETRGRR